MKRCLKIFAIVVGVLVGMILVGIVLAFLFPNADHEKLGTASAGIVLAFTFGIVLRKTTLRKPPKDKSE